MKKKILFILLAIILTICFAWPGRPGKVSASVPGRAPQTWYAAVDGSPSGDGSLANPWDLQTAIQPHPSIQPGDTLYLRGGSYTQATGFESRLAGTPENIIHVRPYPGEHVVFDRAGANDGVEFLRIYSTYTWYWDFESTDTNPGVRTSGDNLKTSGEGNKLINWVIHDANNNAFGRSANEIYGCVMYFNGTDGSGNGHQLYVQNPNPEKPTKITECLVFYSYAFGIHAYASGSGKIEGVIMTGNVVFNNGSAQTADGQDKDNILIAGKNGVSGIVMAENMSWAAAPNTRNFSLGRYWNLNHDITMTDNYVVGDTYFANGPFEIMNLNGNSFYGTFRGANPADYPNNLYQATFPTVNKIFIRPNLYDPKRAHIIVYNWENKTSVQVDLNSILDPGDWFKIVNAQDFYGKPIHNAQFTGGLVTLPMTGLSTAKPIGPGQLKASETPGSKFNVFVLLPGKEIIPTHWSYLPAILLGGQ